MSNTHNLHPYKAWSALAFGVVAAGIALFVNTAIVGLRPLQKLAPEWSPADYTSPELAVIAVSATAGVILAIFVQNASFKPLSVSRRHWHWASLVGLVNISFLLLGAVLTTANAPLFRALIKESGGVSIAQAVLIALAIIVFVRLAFARRTAHVRPVLGIPFQVVAAAFAVVLFVLLMEEISYGQHYIGWQTPDSFSGNVQNETNIHNFYTYRFELVYYSGAIFAFCILPIWACGSNLSIVRNNSHLVPPAIFGIAAMPLTAFLFESWSIVPLQIYYFLGIALTLCFAWRMMGRQKLLPIATVAAMSVCQVIYVFYGHRLVAGHEISEMRELSIAWMIFVYAAWLYWRCSAPDSSESRQQIEAAG